MQRPTTSEIFTRAGLPGTFPLAEVMLDSPTAPEVIAASTWKMSVPIDGHPRVEVVNDGCAEYQSGGGMHVTLSPADLHNTCVAAGPDFRKGVISPIPSGNVDFVSMLLWLMSIEPSEPLDGCVLSEALVGDAPPLRGVDLGRRNPHNQLEIGAWEQHLNFTETNGVHYLEEGKGRWVPQLPSPKPTK